MSSLLPGHRNGVLRRVMPYELHCERYYHLQISLDESPDRITEARLAQDAVHRDPRPGDRVSVHTMMGLVTGVQKRPPEGDVPPGREAG